MSELNAPSRSALADSDHAEQLPVRLQESDSLTAELPAIEDHLGEIIRSARAVAASAEELLREIALRQQVMSTGRGTCPPPVVGLALGPLDATRDLLFAALQRLPRR